MYLTYSIHIICLKEKRDDFYEEKKKKTERNKQYKLWLGELCFTCAHIHNEKQCTAYGDYSQIHRCRTYLACKKFYTIFRKIKAQ